MLFLHGLAVTDSLHLVIILGYWIVKDGATIDMPPQIYQWVCYIVFLISTGSALCGTYITLAMTLDRLIAVKWPLKSLTWCTLKRTRVTIACAIIFSFLAKLPYGWVTKAAPSCVSFQMKRTQLVEAYYWINSSISCYIPFTILLILNLLIVESMHKRGKYFKQQRSSDGGNIEMTRQASTTSFSSLGESQTKSTTSKSEHLRVAKKARTQKTLIRMLLLVTFSFLPLCSPIYIFYLVYLFVSPYSSPVAFAKYAVFGRICGKLYQLNFAINFYLYCLGGSKFRKDLRKMLSTLCKK